MTPTEYFAGAVKRYRQLRGWTQPQLAERCQRAGLDWDRSVIANLESARRGTVTIHEVFVAAHVLGVAPMQLVLPLGVEEAVEVVPGVTVHPLHALEWTYGVGQLPGAEISAADFATAAAPIQLLRRYRELHEDAEHARGVLRRFERAGGDAASPGMARATTTYTTALEGMVMHARSMALAGVAWAGMAPDFYDDAVELGMKIPAEVVRAPEQVRRGKRRA